MWVGRCGEKGVRNRMRRSVGEGGLKVCGEVGRRYGESGGRFQRKPDG